MADTNNVYISGAGKGSLEEAFGDLPPWATQKTSEDIQKLLKDLLSVETKALDAALKCCAASGTTGPSKAEIQQVNDEINKLSKNFKNLNQETDKTRKNNAAEDKARKSSADSEKASSLAWNKLVGGMVGVGKGLLNVQKQYFTTSHDLFKSGVNLIDGQADSMTSMRSLNQIVTMTGLRLETFQKVVEKYSSSINAVGVNKFARTLTDTNRRLIDLGFSSEQQAELLGTLVESESQYADIRNKSSAELAEDAVRLGRNMTRLSMLTGQSSEQLQENMKSMAKNTDSAVVSAMYGEEAASRMNTFASSMKDADVGVMLQTMAASGQVQVTKAYQDFAKAGMGGFADELGRISVAARDGTISATEANRQIMALGKTVTSDQMAQLQRLSQTSSEGAQESLSMISKIRAQSNQTSTASDGQIDSAIRSQAALSDFSTQLEKASSLAQMAFPLLEEQVMIASEALKLLNINATAAAGMFSTESKAIIATALQIASIGAIILSSMTTIKSSVSLLGDIVKGIGGAGKGFIGALRSPIGMLSKLGVAGGVVGAGAAGFMLGKEVIAPLIDAGISKLTGQDDSLGTALYNLLHGDENSSILSPTPATKTPAPSVISSPSAIPPPPPAAPGGSAAATPAPAPSLPGPPPRSSINSILDNQTTLLNQSLEALKALVSVNQDILRQSKIH